MDEGFTSIVPNWLAMVTVDSAGALYLHSFLAPAAKAVAEVSRANISASSGAPSKAGELGSFVILLAPAISGWQRNS